MCLQGVLVLVLSFTWFFSGCVFVNQDVETSVTTRALKTLKWTNHPTGALAPAGSMLWLASDECTSVLNEPWCLSCNPHFYLSLSFWLLLPQLLEVSLFVLTADRSYSLNWVMVTLSKYSVLLRRVAVATEMWVCQRAENRLWGVEELLHLYILHFYHSVKFLYISWLKFLEMFF